MARVQLEREDGDVLEKEPEDNYFGGPSKSLEFIHSGCAVLDGTLGGGWPLTRIANLVGDESTGKTLLAIEACANFARQFKQKGGIYYREAESAFDQAYAGALGMPLDRVSFIEPDQMVTIEDFYDDLVDCCKRQIKREEPGLYILDSLDALSDEEELKADFGKGTYGTKKAKDMSKLLRMCRAKIAEANMCLIIVSQTRDKISEGFGGFGKKKTRSGGKALNFYASQCLWLSHLETLQSEKSKIKRPVAIRIRAKCEKNKIALPYRTCEFTIRFGHGIDSLVSSVDWLEKADLLHEVTKYSRKTYLSKLESLSDDEYFQEVQRVDKKVARLWERSERNFMQGVRRKYR
jgi:recombination protein RecA